MSQWYLSFLLKHIPVKGDFKYHIVTQTLYKPHLPVQHTEVKLGHYPNIPTYISPTTLPKPFHILAIPQESQSTPVNIVFLTSALQLLPWQWAIIWDKRGLSILLSSFFLCVSVPPCSMPFPIVLSSLSQQQGSCLNMLWGHHLVN